MDIIYEVNIEVDKSAIEDFKSWIKPHINEVSANDGFGDATLLKEINVGQARWCVQYQVKSMELLQRYLDLHAAKMRQQAIDKFGDLLQINRRILQLED